MLELQERISQAQAATGGLRGASVDVAVREYFKTLSLAGAPLAADFDAAQARAAAVVKQELLSGASVATISGGAELDAQGLAQLALSFDAIARPPQIPHPVVRAEPKTMTLAFAGLLGALGGMFALALLMHLAFDMRDLGLVLGGPLGALLAVLIAHRLSRFGLLTRILPWAFAQPKLLSGSARKEYEKSVRTAIAQWTEWAVAMLAILCYHEPGSAEPKDKDKAFRRLAKVIYALHQAPPDTLAVVADELIQEARNSGFEGLEGQPAFMAGTGASGLRADTLTWANELQSKYETFGHVAEGDRVSIERPAVVFDGKVVQRGLVRKVRDGA
jgi:hypothetical protein